MTTLSILVSLLFVALSGIVSLVPTLFTSLSSAIIYTPTSSTVSSLSLISPTTVFPTSTTAVSVGFALIVGLSFVLSGESSFMLSALTTFSIMATVGIALIIFSTACCAIAGSILPRRTQSTQTQYSVGDVRYAR